MRSLTLATLYCSLSNGYDHSSEVFYLLICIPTKKLMVDSLLVMIFERVVVQEDDIRVNEGAYVVVHRVYCMHVSKRKPVVD